MKATMDIMGVITVTPENGAEAFALDQWMLKAQTLSADPHPLGPRAAWRGGSLRIETKYEWEKK